MFARWGRFVYRFRWVTLVASALLLGVSVIGVLTGGQLAGNGGFGADLEAGRTARLVAREIHREQPVAVTSGMTLIFSSSTLNATDPAFQSALEAAIAPLKSDPRVAGLTTPYGVPAGERATFISLDGHKALDEIDNPESLARYLKVSADPAVTLIGSAPGEVLTGKATVTGRLRAWRDLAIKSIDVAGRGDAVSMNAASSAIWHVEITYKLGGKQVALPYRVHVITAGPAPGGQGDTLLCVAHFSIATP